ncbi:hypothetical protein PR003_g21885 [Phytophthora rubi]|nr:hypothetical protein PR002_g23194 [Phytophthora rubi]KAE9031339.1 hypothetical protein PR001_g11034 [Phytophthora rubi]KAE9303927.1 hypothetical protein PR003_g21885 [Phytophthora rubi]
MKLPLSYLSFCSSASTAKDIYIVLHQNTQECRGLLPGTQVFTTTAIDLQV